MYVDYILSFLCPEISSDIQNYVSYAHDTSCAKTPVVIKRSTFFDGNVYGNPASIPSLPLKEIEGIPLLFGEPVIEERNGQVIVHADLVASTFFLITRYEEMVRRDERDKYGRFIGKESLPYKAGFLSRPVVDEYATLLRKCLRRAGIQVEDPHVGFSNILLTHDVDVPWNKYTLAGAFKRFGGELIHQHRFISYPFLNIIGRPENDPNYTFQTLIDADRRIANATSIYFIKSGGHKKPEDAEPYIIDKGFSRLMSLLDSSGAILGYHASYEAGKQMNLIPVELKTLRSVTYRRINYSRNHYLASREPCDYNELIRNGITDDFTMGYADIAGFRLGTSRPVKWVDPASGNVTELTLHPLTIMDVTLTGESYMGLDEKSAYDYGDNLIKETYCHGGEVVLLWHNNEDIGDNDSVNWRNYIHFIETINKYNCNNSFNYAKD